jgi:hypothetical protein
MLNYQSILPLLPHLFIRSIISSSSQRFSAATFSAASPPPLPPRLVPVCEITLWYTRSIPSAKQHPPDPRQSPSCPE